MEPAALIDQWRRGLRIAHAAHYESAKFYHRMHLVLSLPAVLISALLSTSVFISLQDSSNGQIKILMATFSVMAVVLSSLQAAMRFSERSERHKTAAVQLGEIRRELEQQLVFVHLDEAVLERLRKKWDAADRQAPTVPSWIYRQTANQVFASGDSGKK